MSADLLKNAAITSQIILVGAGLILLWKHFLRPAARANPRPPRLAPGNASLGEGVRFIFHGLCGGFLASFLIGALAKPLGLHGDPLAIAATAALHFGALIGFCSHLYFHRPPTPSASPAESGIRAGLFTFIVAMPIVVVVNLAWIGVLKLIGVDVDRQPAVELVGRLGTSPWFFVFIASAVIIAPASEELLFRAGLFRLFRARQLRWVAFVVPSLIFASIHLHLASFLPLAVLGIIFSFAYERTGTILTPIVAHAAFNLNNLLMVLSGADQ